MKILVSAIACSPLRGSEGAVGWTAVNALARHHEVWVMTHEESRPEIESWLKTHSLPDSLHMEYLGRINQYSHNPLINRFQCWKVNFDWHGQVLDFARTLQAQHRFDLVHHVTCATWRVASPFWQLGIPVVWGPLGGGERFPTPFARILSPSALVFETIRGVSNQLTARNPSIRRAAKNVSACIAANAETLDLLVSLRGSREGVSQLLQVFFDGNKITSYAARMSRKDYAGPLRIFAGGNLEARKGVALALHAIARIPGIQLIYTLGGGGPEKRHLEKLARQLGLENRVVFTDGFKGDAYRDELFRSHLYLLPSLRDSAGITLMEAMLAGAVPIVADCGGPHDVVTNSSGIRVPVTTPEKMADEISRAIVLFDADRDRLKSHGLAAHERIAQAYSEDAYLRSIETVFQQVVGNKR